MIAILTKDARFYDYLTGLLAEQGYAVCEEGRAKLMIVDLDSEAVPKKAPRVITVSSSIFESSDLTRPFLQDALFSLCRERLGSEQAGGKDSLATNAQDVLPSDEVVLKENFLWVKGEEITLTPAEYRLFSLLYRHRGDVVSLADCEAVCRVRTSRGNSVSVAVASLRKKLDYRLDRRLIVSVRGEGYRLLLG